MGAVDFFLKIDGISGDSTDSKHKGEIEVESFSWGVSQAASVGGGGAGTGKAVFQDFHFTALTSVASPNLFLKCCTGEHLKQAVLIGRAASQRGQADEFMKITLTDVLVGSFNDTGGQGPQPHLDDSVALRYRSATSGATQPAKIIVTPASGGMLRFDQATGTIQVIPVEGGALEVGTHGGATSRAVFEYDVKILIGLLTAPNSTATLRLITTEIREAATPPGNTDLVDVAASRTTSATDENEDDKNAKQPKKAKKIRFDVIMYTPADLELTADDLTRKGKRIGTIVVDPDGDPATLITDLTKLLKKRELESFGIRLQLRGARVKDFGEDDGDENDEDFSPDRDASQSDSADEGDGDGNARKANADVFASFTVDLVLDTQ